MAYERKKWDDMPPHLRDHGWLGVSTRGNDEEMQATKITLEDGRTAYASFMYPVPGPGTGMLSIADADGVVVIEGEENNTTDVMIVYQKAPDHPAEILSVEQHLEEAFYENDVTALLLKLPTMAAAIAAREAAKAAILDLGMFTAQKPQGGLF